MLAFGVPCVAVGLPTGRARSSDCSARCSDRSGLAILDYVLNETLPETLPDLGVLLSIGGGSMAKAARSG